jgi:hypothetical protein
MEIKSGAIADSKDKKDYNFEALGTKPMTKEDWEKGYDIEKVLGYKIPIKNQFNSYSCVGQAYAYYLAVWRSLINKRHREVSAKSIYSLISLGFNQGAYLRDGAKSITKIGAMWENLLNSYKRDGTTDEAWMTDKSWLNDDIKEIMTLLKSTEYWRVSNFTIDGFAKAIRDGYGMVSGITGTNNGTWMTEYPKPPLNTTPQNKLWGHALYFGKFRIKNGKKEVGVLNSWGEDCGDKGWQWLGEEWFTENGDWVFTPWMITINFNNMIKEGARVLKDKNSSAVGIFLPAISEAVLKSYCLNFGKEVPEKHINNGLTEIDWENLLDGEYELK